MALNSWYKWSSSLLGDITIRRSIYPREQSGNLVALRQHGVCGCFEDLWSGSAKHRLLDVPFAYSLTKQDWKAGVAPR